jgi:hypothetical protein
VRRVFLLVAIVAAASTGCGAFGPDGKTFVVHVESIDGPTTVSGNVAFTQQLHGWIGSNLCYYFKEFRTEKTSQAIDVTVIGAIDDVNAICPTQPRSLDQTLTVPAPVSDPFVIRIHQPDGTILSKTIRVE